MQVKVQHANPDKFKKGIPKIIKIALGALLAAPLVILGAKGIRKIISLLKH